MLLFVIFCLFIITCAAEFILCGFDKGFARAGTRRIPEKTFFLLAALGGGMGLWLGMMAFHHKTRKAKFIAAATLSIIFWVSLLIYLSGARL